MCVCVCVLSRVCLLVALWTVASQGPLSMEFSRQEFWSGVLFPSPRDPPDPGIKSVSLMSPELAGGLFTTSVTWEACSVWNRGLNAPSMSH